MPMTALMAAIVDVLTRWHPKNSASAKTRSSSSLLSLYSTSARLSARAGWILLGKSPSFLKERRASAMSFSEISHVGSG